MSSCKVTTFALSCRFLGQVCIKKIQFIPVHKSQISNQETKLNICFTQKAIIRKSLLYFCPIRHCQTFVLLGHIAILIYTYIMHRFYTNISTSLFNAGARFANCHIKYTAMTLLALLLITTALSSCKRGEDDPWISLLTRNQRLEGDWVLKYSKLSKKYAKETTTIFSVLQCDTAGISGTSVQNMLQQDEYQDTLLNTLILNDGQNSQVFNIEISYTINIYRDGTYRCLGNYSFYNSAIGAQSSGDFISDTNTWYWENSNNNREAISFANFPFMDPTAVIETGMPIRFHDMQTFDISRLADKELVLDINSKQNSSLLQEFDSYVVNLQSCQTTVKTNTTTEVLGRWEFTNTASE